MESLIPRALGRAPSIDGGRGPRYRDLAKEVVPCPLCRSERFDILARHDRYRMGLITVRCVSCGLVMTNPMLTEQATRRFYEQGYRRFYRATEAPSVEYVQTYGLESRAAYTVDALVRFGTVTERAAVLDIGCSEGSVLREVRRRGVRRTVGIEPAPTFAAFARHYAECPVLPSLDAVLHDELGPFDLSIVNHVLEHVRDPLTLLRQVVSLLKPDGAVYVDVPDATRYSSVADLHIAHVFHFTPRTLAATARAAGLGVAYLERHDPPFHPPSVRALLTAGVQETAALPDEMDDALVHANLRRIDSAAWRFYLRRSLLGRAVFGTLRRLRAAFAEA